MGDKREVKKIACIFFLLVSLLSFSQTTISGTVRDKSNSTGVYATIVLKSMKDSTIINYTNSEYDGTYFFDTNEAGIFILSFSALSYETKEIAIEIKEPNNIVSDIFVDPKVTELNEVVVRANVPIVVKKDTIIFDVKSFIRGGENVVEDLLKNIPGLSVDSEGTIKFNNREVEKVQVEGGDFFQKGYKILTKSLPSEPIDKVEILLNYSNNPLLKDVENSERVALNLKLSQEFKNIWFGSLNVGFDGLASTTRYSMKKNLAKFTRKNKNYILSNFNNTGYDPVGDIDAFIKPLRSSESSNLGDNQQLNDLVTLSTPFLNFKKERVNFNNAELVSVNSIFNPHEKLKLKINGFFNADENNFFSDRIDMINVGGMTFINNEQYLLQSNKQVGFGRLEAIYEPSKTELLESITRYSIGSYEDESNLTFNEISTLENLERRNNYFDQKITYTNQLRRNKVLLLTGRFKTENGPQNYEIDQFFYQDLFPTLENIESIEQYTQNRFNYLGFEAHFINRRTNEDLFEIKIGNQYRTDIIQSSLFLLDDNSEINQPLDYQNDTNYTINNSYISLKYDYSQIEKLKISGSFTINQFINELKNEEQISQETPFWINPRIGMDWVLSRKNRLALNYSFNTVNAGPLDVFNNFAISGFRSFQKGTGSFNQLSSSSLFFNYQYGNFNDRFFFNTYVLYNKNNDYFSTNSTINQNFTLTEKILIRDQEFVNASSELNYYLKDISSNLKIKLQLTESNFDNLVNNSSLRSIKSLNYDFGFDLRSGFLGIINYHIGTKWATNRIDNSTTTYAFTNNVSFLDLVFVPSNTFNLEVQTERYQFGNIDSEEDTFYFMDFEAKYTIEKNRLALSLQGQNLFNTKAFSRVTISDTGNSTTEFRLLPRFVLLHVEYKF